MSAENRVEPPEVVGIVEQYVESELRDAEQYSNRRPLDESGIFSLHLLAAHIYLLGFRDGERSAFLRADRERRRQREDA